MTLALAFVLVVAALTLLPAVNTFANLAALRTPDARTDRPGVSILIPARNEEATIETCVRQALASTGVDLEVIVLDDGSTDATRAIIERIAAADPRLRVASAPPLPPSAKGKPHACHVLSTLATRPYLLFIDADVRLAPDAASRMVPPPGTALVSGVPRQELGGLFETLLVPMINSLIYGYLPVPMMRRMPDRPSLAAACGQLMMVRADAYRACGGHAAILDVMHDGLQLARRFRAAGFATDLLDATPLARCRMYRSAAETWNGFGKNATEGMARPLALPIWTVLLLGGHVLTLPALIVAWFVGPVWFGLSLLCLILAIVARARQAARCAEAARVVPLHPLAVLLTLALQWTALARHWRGGTVEWRGRRYVTST